MLRPQLVALGLPSALPYAPELAQRRLGLQLVRVTF
jgi:hypothetical protein